MGYITFFYQVNLLTANFWFLSKPPYSTVYLNLLAAMKSCSIVVMSFRTNEQYNKSSSKYTRIPLLNGFRFLQCGTYSAVVYSY